MAAIALTLACRQARLQPQHYLPQRKGLVLGCGLAGVTGMIDFAEDVREQTARFVSPIRFPQTVGNYLSGALARAFDFCGPASTIACGSASSLEALCEAVALLQSDRADVVIAGGCEKLTPGLALGLAGGGVFLADGACLFVLERLERAQQRKAPILATVKQPKESDASYDVLSTAGFTRTGAVCIEHWTGRTIGADGAAAVAAALGAAFGLEVPTTSESSWEISRLDRISPPPVDILVTASAGQDVADREGHRSQSSDTTAVREDLRHLGLRSGAN